MMKIIYILIIFMIPVLLSSCAPQTSDVYPLKGNIDLTGVCYSKIVPLDGQWNFYWDILVDHKNLGKGQEWIEVPKSWEQLDYPVEGFATYHLEAKVEPGREYGIKLKNIPTAYNFYVDGKLQSSSGRVAAEKNESHSRFGSDIVVLSPESNKVDFILQVSSYSYYQAGITESILVGEPKMLHQYRDRRFSFFMLLSGIILIMSFYHLLFFLFRKKDLSYLYFGLAGFLVFLHALMEANKVYGLLFGHTSLQFDEKVQTVLLILVLPATLFSLYHIFKKTFSRMMLYFFSLASIIAAVGIVILPFGAENPVWPIFSIIIMLGIVFVLYVLIKNMIQKKLDAIIVLAGIILLILAIGNDFLIDYGYIYTPRLFYAGWTAFLLSISILIAKQFADSYRRTGILTGELNKKNVDLENAYHEIEQRVRARTKQLNDAKRKLQKANEVLKKDKRLFKSLSITDGLTDLYNHSHIIKLLSREVSRSQRYGSKFSVFMMDIDNFKAINDTYGHQVGDMVLKNLGTLMKNNLRESDIAGRYGGEEFLIIMPETEIVSALSIGERLRQNIENHHWEKSGLKITISGGMVEYDGKGGYEGILNTVDKLLYKAKKNGKNRIEKTL